MDKQKNEIDSKPTPEMEKGSESTPAPAAASSAGSGKPFEPTRQRHLSFLEQVVKGMLPEVSAAIEADRSLINKVNKDGRSVLHAACYQGDLSMILYLLDIGYIVNNKDKLGTIPLHVAAVRGHVGVVRELLRRGANLNEQDNYGMTPLHMACQCGISRKEVAEILLQHSPDKSLKDAKGRTAFDMCEGDRGKALLAALTEYQ